MRYILMLIVSLLLITALVVGPQLLTIKLYKTKHQKIVCKICNKLLLIMIAIFIVALVIEGISHKGYFLAVFFSLLLPATYCVFESSTCSLIIDFLNKRQNNR